MYYGLFDKNGYRIATYVEGIHKDIPKESIQITEEEQRLYTTNNYKRNMETGEPELIPVEPIVLTPAEKRKYEYETNPIITWREQDITVDQANLVYLQYSAEGSEKATEVQDLILAAKESIRLMYPDKG